jgi:hypothetical protein
MPLRTVNQPLPNSWNLSFFTHYALTAFSQKALNEEDDEENEDAEEDQTGPEEVRAFDIGREGDPLHPLDDVVSGRVGVGSLAQLMSLDQQATSSLDRSLGHYMQ